MSLGFCIGVWDGCHIGHLRRIEAAASLVNKLIVATVADAAVKAQKGDDRPMFPLEHRVAIIESLKWTTHSIISQTFDPYDCFIEAMQKFGKIDIYIKGEDQAHIDTSRIEALVVQIITL